MAGRGGRWGENLTSLIQASFYELVKRICTSLPGKVITYDPVNRTADIQPAIRILLRSGGYKTLPLVTNVPVIIPSGGGWTIDFPLKAGDPVQLIFNQRGIKNFLQGFQLAQTSGGILAMDSPVAFPCFTRGVNPSSGISIQSLDGKLKLEVSDSGIVGQLDAVNFSFNSDGSMVFSSGATITADGDFQTATGRKLGTCTNFSG